MADSNADSVDLGISWETFSARSRGHLGVCEGGSCECIGSDGGLFQHYDSMIS